MIPWFVVPLAYGIYKKLTRKGSQIESDPTLLVSTVDSLPVVYGSRRIGGHLVYASVAGETSPTVSDNKYLWLVVALCHGPVQAIDEVYIDGNLAIEAGGTLRAVAASVTVATSSVANPTLITTAAAHLLYPGDTVAITGHSGSTPALNATWTVLTTPSSLTFTIGANVSVAGTGGTMKRQNPWFVDANGRYVECAKYLGSATQDTGTTGLQADASTISASSLTSVLAEWTSSAAGKGVAYLLLRLSYLQDLYGVAGSALPTVEAAVRGRTVAEVTATGVVYSRDPVLCLRDYLTNSTYGVGVAAASCPLVHWTDVGGAGWTNVNTLTVGTNAATVLGTSLNLIGDADVSNKAYTRRVVPFTSDGDKALSIVVKRSATYNNHRFRVANAAGDLRLDLKVDFSAAVPAASIMSSYGELLTVDAVDGGTAYRITAVATGVVATNSTYLYAHPAIATTTDTADLYVGEINIWDAAAIPVGELDDGQDELGGFRLERRYAEESVYVPANTGAAAISAVATLTATYAITKATHGLSSADWVWIRNHNAAPTVDGRYQVTVLSTATYTIAAAVTTAATTLGTFQKLTTQARFTADLVLDTTQPLRDNLDKLLSACRGQLSLEGGKYRLVIRRGAATDAAGRTLTAYPLAARTDFTLSESNIVGPLTFRVPGISECPNTVRCTFPNDARRNQSEVFEWPLPGMTNTYLSTDNNFRVTREIELPGTADRYTAEQIAMVALEEGRHQIGVRLTAFESALTLAVGDVVALTHATPGWTAKAFWVTEVAPRPDGLVDLGLVEYESTAYDETVTDEADTASDTGLPSAWYVPAVTSLQATTGGYDPWIRLSWTAPNDQLVSGYEVQAKRTSGPADAEYRFVALAPGDATYSTVPNVRNRESWQVRVRAQNRIGVNGAWTVATCTVALLGPATFEHTVAAEATSVYYTVTFGDYCERVEFYSVENVASGGTEPTETSNDRAATLLRPASGNVATQRIVTTASYYRRTFMVGYSGDNLRGEVSPVDETQSTAGSLVAPASLTCTGATADTLSFTWSNGTATDALTHISGSKMIGDVIHWFAVSVASAVATATATSLTAGWTYDCIARHERSGALSAYCTSISATCVALATAPAAFVTATGVYTTESKGITYVNHDVEWTDAGAWEMYESDSAIEGTGVIYASAASGNTLTISHPDVSGSFYYYLRATDPLSEWASCGSNPLSFETS